MSGGYEDDEDHGDYIVYTGQGGEGKLYGREANRRPGTQARKPRARPQLRRRAAGSGRSRRRGRSSSCSGGGIPVDGLFYVQDYWSEPGKSAFDVYRFQLVRTDDTGAVTNLPEGSQQDGAAPRVRNTGSENCSKYRCSARSEGVERLHMSGVWRGDCHIRRPLRRQAAHIRPLGRPHDGPDIPENILCLCPNDHVRFDYGVIFISDSGEVLTVASGEVIGDLRTVAGHTPDHVQFAYHRSLWGRASD